MIEATATATPIEPVHWGARLRRGLDVRYTEVGDTALLCRTTARSLHVASPVVVGLWALLDGRPLEVATQSISDGWSDVDRRQIIELLRRLKAVGLIEDTPPDADPGELPSLDQTSDTPTSLVLRGRILTDDDENGTGDGEAVVLELRSGQETTSDETVELHFAAGVPAPLRTADGTEVATLVTTADGHVKAGDQLSPIDALSVWVDALLEPGLDEPGVLDWLAALTDTHPMHFEKP